MKLLSQTANAVSTLVDATDTAFDALGHGSIVMRERVANWAERSIADAEADDILARGERELERRERRRDIGKRVAKQKRDRQFTADLKQADAFFEDIKIQREDSRKRLEERKSELQSVA